MLLRTSMSPTKSEQQINDVLIFIFLVLCSCTYIPCMCVWFLSSTRSKFLVRISVCDSLDVSDNFSNSIVYARRIHKLILRCWISAEYIILICRKELGLNSLIKGKIISFISKYYQKFFFHACHSESKKYQQKLIKPVGGKFKTANRFVAYIDIIKYLYLLDYPYALSSPPWFCEI